MLIAVAGSALGIMVATWMLIHQRGGIRWLFGGKGRYAAFASVYEMGPQGQVPVYAQGACLSTGSGLPTAGSMAAITKSSVPGSRAATACTASEGNGR